MLIQKLIIKFEFFLFILIIKLIYKMIKLKKFYKY
jgi:hypothetical protein